MIRATRRFGIWLVGLVFGWIGIALVMPVAIGQQPAIPEGEAPPINLRNVMEQAKGRVFPALVFVKPIVEDYEMGEKQKRQVFGSGVIITPDGLAVTNNHVVDKAIKVNCVLFTKEQLPARIMGRDPDTDLALLKIEAPPGKLPLPYGEFADSDMLSEGDFVMALGSPFGFTRSISLGVISNRQRYLGFETEYKYNTWLQTDAAINPGNSGGPLVNVDGEIVGINTLGIMLAEGVGFAIPSNVAKRIVERLKTGEGVKRASSGLKLQPLKDFFTDTFTDVPSGVLVADVEKGSPAEAAGIHKGDVLLAVEDKELRGDYAEDLPGIEWVLAEMPLDRPVKALLLRAGQTVEVAMTLAAKGKVEGDTFDCRRWNFTAKEISKYKEPELHFYRQQGLFVLAVRYPGNASAAGLRSNDIVVSIDRTEVKTLDDVKGIYARILADTARPKRVLIEVLRDGYQKWVTLDYTKDYEKVE